MTDLQQEFMSLLSYQVGPEDGFTAETSRNQRFSVGNSLSLISSLGARKHIQSLNTHYEANSCFLLAMQGGTSRLL